MGVRRVVSFRARGNKLIGFVNAIRHSDIICFSQKYSMEEYTGKIYISDLERLKLLAENMKIDLFIEEYQGKMFTVLKYKARYGLLIGFIFMAAFVFVMSNIVVRIEINGNENIKDDEILYVLSEIGIEKGTFIPSLDIESCELKMKTRLGNASWAAIRTQGGRVIVDIHEGIPVPHTVHNNIPCNIVSERDAIVTDAKVMQGTLKIERGYSVGKGDLLVSGVVENGAGNYMIVHALADITGEYIEKETFVQYFESSQKEYEEKIKKRSLEFFGFRIPLGFEKKYSKSADYTETTDYFSVLGIEIPIGLVVSEYTEYEMKNITYTLTEAEEEIQKKISIYENNFYSDKEIVRKDIKKNEYEDRIEYEITYTIRGKIGVEKELFISKN